MISNLQHVIEREIPQNRANEGSSSYKTTG